MTNSFGVRPSLSSKFFPPVDMRPIVKWRRPTPTARKLPAPPPALSPVLLSVTAATRIMAVACTMFGVTRPEFRGRSRRIILVYARRYAALRMSRELGLSTPQIGRLIGKDASSVWYMLDEAVGRGRRFRREHRR